MLSASFSSILFTMNLPIGNLKSLAKCPVCHKKYAPAVAVPLFEDETHSTVHLSCPSCGVSSIFFVSANQWGVASVGVLTDLESEEAERLLGKEPVSSEHALDAYVSFGESPRRLREFL